MINGYPIEVSPSGTVLLGPDVSCDGFHYGHPVRVQTHIHLDHMDGFATSKGNQHVLLSAATRELLIAELDADLPYRENIRTVDVGVQYEFGMSRLVFLSSGHMLGAVQVQVDLQTGDRLGYSGDFQWPLDDPIQVDALVVDATYGSPASIRKYSQDEAEHCLLELVLASLRRGPVHIKANRGTLQRALQVIAGNVDCVLVGSPQLSREVEVYRKFGYGIDWMLADTDDDARAAMREGRAIRFYGKGDGLPVDIGAGTSITLSAYMSDPRHPLLKYSESAYRVAFSNHADFEGTLEYVHATGAKFVVADNTRGAGVELASEISARLRIPARPSSTELTYGWGA